MEEILLTSNLDDEIVNILRRIEQTNKKIVNRKASMYFNIVCLKNIIQPKYMKFNK